MHFNVLLSSGSSNINLCVCVCVCVYMFVCILCDCICDQLAAKSYTGSADRADRRQSGFDQSQLPWWLGIRPITSDVIGGTCAKTMQWQSKDNAMQCNVFLHLIVWFHQEWIGRSNVFSHRRRHWPRIFQLVECMWKCLTMSYNDLQCLTIKDNVKQCKTLYLPAGSVHVKNRRHHQNTKHQSSPMSYTPDIILILDCKKADHYIAISSGNKSCELAGWNDFLIDIHLMHGSVQRL